jgi:hypothetical protein
MQLKMLTLLSGISFGLSGVVAAESVLPTTGQTTPAKQEDKKTGVARMMQLNADQAKIFWPLYDAYQIDINKFNVERAAVVNKLTMNQDTMTDKLALDLLDKALDIEKKRLDLKKELVEKFSKNLPPKVVARYYEIETKLDANVTAEVAKQVPLVK